MDRFVVQFNPNYGDWQLADINLQEIIYVGTEEECIAALEAVTFIFDNIMYYI